MVPLPPHAPRRDIHVPRPASAVAGMPLAEVLSTGPEQGGCALRTGKSHAVMVEVELISACVPGPASAVAGMPSAKVLSTDPGQGWMRAEDLQVPR